MNNITIKDIKMLRLEADLFKSKADTKFILSKSLEWEAKYKESLLDNKYNKYNKSNKSNNKMNYLVFLKNKRKLNDEIDNILMESKMYMYLSEKYDSQYDALMWQADFYEQKLNNEKLITNLKDIELKSSINVEQLNNDIKDLKNEILNFKSKNKNLLFNNKVLKDNLINLENRTNKLLSN